MYNITISYKLKDNYVELWHKITADVQPSFDNEYIINADTQRELDEKFKHFNDNYGDYKQAGNTLQYDDKHNFKAKLEVDRTNELRAAELKSLLASLTEDVVQSLAGEVVPNIEQRKQQFIEYHNELRVLEGKTPRNAS